MEVSISKKATLDLNQKAFTNNSNGFSNTPMKMWSKKEEREKRRIKGERFQTLHHNQSAISVIFLQLNKTIQTSTATNIMLF